MFFLFHFQGLREPQKYFYNENFQIYGILVVNFGFLLILSSAGLEVFLPAQLEMTQR